MQVDLLYSYAGYGRMHMHQSTCSKRGPPCWAGKLAHCTCMPYLTPQYQSRSSSAQL